MSFKIKNDFYKQAGNTDLIEYTLCCAKNYHNSFNYQAFKQKKKLVTILAAIWSWVSTSEVSHNEMKFWLCHQCTYDANT